MNNDESQASRGAVRRSDEPIRVAGSTFGPELHICAFFNSSEEEYGVLLPLHQRGRPAW
jgi:hypothetical protein